MSDQITFSEQPLGTVNPIYTFADNTVTCIGEIVSDSADPGSPAIAANSSYMGSIFIDFQNALSQVSFAAGYFDNLESTEIILIGSDGSVLFDTMNEDLGYLPYSYTATNDIGVSSIEVLVRGFDASGFSADSINFTTIAQLFTSGADQVDFNNLNPNQKTAIVNGSDEFHGSGGSDTVVLPSVANFNESVGSAKTLGWTNTSASEFFTQSQVGDTYNVSGTDGNYVIAAGQGTDNISISGAGKSTFFAGNGSDSVVIKGGGTLVVSGALLGSATIGSRSTLELVTPSSGTISFDIVRSTPTSAASGGKLVIDGNTMPTGTISGLRVGDTIDLAGVSFANGGAVGLTSANVLQVIEGGQTYNLQLGGTVADLNKVSFRLSSDSNSGTNIQLVSGLSINVTFDASVSGADNKTGYMSGINAAVQYFENLFTNPTTLNIDAGYGSLADGQSVGTNYGTSLPVFGSSGSPGAFGPAVTYANLRSALVTAGGSGAGTLPANTPFASGTSLLMTPGEEIGLGLLTNNGATIDGYTGFNSTSGLFAYSGAPGASQVDFTGTVEHEISEVMGRRSELNVANGYSPIDLFRYSSSGTRDTTAVPPAPLTSAYFSIDGGATVLGQWNPVSSNGDLADWLNGSGPSTNDAYNYAGTLGSAATLVAADTTLMSALGWTTSAVTQVASSGSVLSAASATIHNWLNIFSGAIDSGAKVLSGGVDTVLGVDIGAVISDGGYLFVNAGGVASNTIVADPGIEVVSAGGKAIGATISGGEQDVFGTASNTIVGNSGLQVVFSGGSAVSTIESSGGTLELFGGAVSSGGAILSGATVEIGSGFAVSNYSVAGGTTLEILSGGSATSTTVASGGILELTNGAIVASANVSSGGILEIASGYVLAVSNGTILSNVVVANSGTIDVKVGGTVSGLTLSSGGVMSVTPGGIVSGITEIAGAAALIQAGGLVTVLSGQSMSGVIVNGNFTISSGGTALATNVGSGFASLYGTMNNTTVGSKGVLAILSGGTAVDTTINNGGTLELLFGANLSGNTTLGVGATEEIGSNASISGFVVSSGNTLQVDANATYSQLSISGGTLKLMSGSNYDFTPITFTALGGTLVIDGPYAPNDVISGFAPTDKIVFDTAKYSSSGSAVLSSGNLLVVNEGSATFSLDLDSSQNFTGNTFQLTADSVSGVDLALVGASVAAGQTVAVGAGQTSNGVSVLSGGTFDVDSGGVAIATTVSSGGLAFVFSGGVDSAMVISGQRQVWVGGLASKETIASGGVEFDYGVVSSAVVSGGGTQYLNIGGIASATVVRSGGWQDIFGEGSGVATLVASGGNQDVYSGGFAINTTLQSQAWEFVWGGGSGSVTSDAGGYVDVYSGGVAVSASIAAGGWEFSWSGGSALAALVSSGSYLDVFSGGTASGATILGAAWEFDWGSGTRASGTMVSSGGYDDVYSAGAAIGDTVLNGAWQFVWGTGTTASGSVVSSGGYQDVYSGGAATGSIARNGGWVLAWTAGGLTNATISSGGIEFVWSGATAGASIVSNGGVLDDYGTVSGTTILSGGAQEVLSGGVASNTVVSSGGNDFIWANGLDVGARVSSGGQVDILSAGVASGAVASSGGILDVFSGGTAQGDAVSAGGDAFVLAGGSASNLIAGSGGFGFVLSGADVSGATMSGGFMEVESGASASGTVAFGSAGGTFQMDEAKTYGLTLSGFGVPGAIDFSAVAFGGSTSATFNSGTLSVTDGTHTAAIALLGQYVAANFHLSSDGHGGTLVVDPPVSAAEALLTQHT